MAPLRLQTDRLTLRPPAPGDAPAISSGIGERDVAWNLGRAPYPYALHDAHDFIARADQNWTAGLAFVFLMEAPESGVIGCVGLDHQTGDIWEIGYWVAKPFWGRGYTTEAARAVLTWAEATHGITQFVSGHFTDNPASGRVLDKLGFTAVGEVPLYGKARDALCPAIRYTRGAPADMALSTANHFLPEQP